MINIFVACSNINKQKIIDDFASKEISVFKKELINCVTSTIEPIAFETEKLLKDQKFLDNILSENAKKAQLLARKTILEIKRIVGVIS